MPPAAVNKPALILAGALYALLLAILIALTASSQALRTAAVSSTSPAPASPPAGTQQLKRGDVNGDSRVDSLDLQTLRNAVAQGRTLPAGDIDGDNWQDGYDVYRLQKILQGRDIRPYPIREFVLSSQNSVHNYALHTDVLGELREIVAGRATTWTVEHAKRGGSRGACNPPLLKINLKDVSMNDRLIGLSNNGRRQLRYDEFKMVPLCRVTFNYHPDLLREYFAYWLLREFGVPTMDTIAFAKVRFDVPPGDNIPMNTDYDYLFLQRHNSTKDQITFAEQFGLSRIIDIISDFVNARWTESTILSVQIRSSFGDAEQIEMDPETTIKYLFLTQFIGDYDRIMHNEDYGLNSSANTWQYIPYDFDRSLDCGRELGARHQLRARGTPDHQTTLLTTHGPQTHRILREIFDNPDNLYSMLEAVDKYPFNDDKTRMKNELRLRFYYYALYHGSDKFASKAGVPHRPYTHQALYLQEATRIISAHAAFPVFCSGSPDRHSELQNMLAQHYPTSLRTPGDANSDGRFNSADLVQVFQAAKYETGQAAAWEEGDWNGDGLFDSADFVAALQAGTYQAGAVALKADWAALAAASPKTQPTPSPTRGATPTATP